MKKSIKIITAIMLVSIIILSSSMVFASIDPASINGTSSVNTQKIKNIGQGAINVLSTIGSIASIIVLIVLGIKYMMGSAEEKAEYKKTLIPYVIVAVLVFAASVIASMVYNFASSL